MSETIKGILAVLAACSIWGLSPMYYKQLGHIPALEVLSHRTIWSFIFFGAILLVQGRLRLIGYAFSSPRQAGLVFFATCMVSINWFLFIYAIQIGRAVESSLGYYILPLVSVLFGVVFYGEKLPVAKWVSVAIAAMAVVVLTVGFGAFPSISIVLAVTFAIYSMLKKSTPTGPVVSVTAEVLMIAPLALIWLWGVHTQGWTGLSGVAVGAFGKGWFDSVLLALSGVLTAGPLILFSYASKRVEMGTLGLFTYVNPTLQFLVAVLVFGELFTRHHAIAFVLIWTALVIYSITALRQDRSARRLATKAGTSSATDTNSRNECSAKPSRTVCSTSPISESQ